MIAQVVNGLAILIGGFVGNALRGGISERFRSILMQAMALAVMLIGLRGAVQTGDVLIVVISLAVGALLGEIINIEKRLENLGEKLRNRVKGAGGGFTEGFVSASLIFCVGAMAIVGSLDAGLRGDYGTILTKSLIDGITAAMLASTLGVGVLFSAAAVFLYQSAITLLAGVLQPLLSDAIIAEMSAVGGLLIFAVGLNMQGVTKIRVGNLLPAIFVPMAYLPIQDWRKACFTKKAPTAGAFLRYLEAIRICGSASAFSQRIRAVRSDLGREMQPEVGLLPTCRKMAEPRPGTAEEP